jgi:phosphonate transport system substrate-binding protein
VNELRIASLMADNAAFFSHDLAEYLTHALGRQVNVMADVPWQARERQLYRGEAHLGVVCGLQYVYAQERNEVPGVDLLCAPVMRAPQYQNRPIYFSAVVVRNGHTARSLGDLRGASFAFNEPTSHSGYGLPRYVLAARGETNGFFSRVVESGAHQRSLQMILDASVDAAAIDTTVLEQEVRLSPDLAGRIRTIDTLGPSPIPPLVISRAVPAALKAELARILLRSHRDPAGERLLRRAHMTRFVAVTDADYDPIRHMAARAATHVPW